RHRDDQGVVPREEQVQHPDAEQPDPELRVGQEGHQVFSGAGVGVPRRRRHQGVSTGRTKKKTATAVITPAIGRDTKIASDPGDMTKLWRGAFSARSPRTGAGTSGASG